MAYRLTYNCTRPNTSADWYFFKEDADAGFEANATHFRTWLDARSDVTVTLTVAEDNLSFKWELDFADEAAYDAFVVDRTALFAAAPYNGTDHLQETAYTDYLTANSMNATETTATV
tara:strand:+ start:346 stop:696 length:351 start_codon:yes stop_codon:yes gene_type:complete